MKPPIAGTAAVLSMLITLASAGTKPVSNTTVRIQVAILLDVSNSMDGLIGQAKNQLWNMVKILGSVTCNGEPAQIEIALYEYGRDANDPDAGYIKQISGFTNDLHSLSTSLYSLTTNGGSEYCGSVIYTALDELAWDSLPGTYRVIFIAGNENFLQGPISDAEACEAARKKGVVVNTLYCGNISLGIKENWNLGSECGGGSYLAIDQHAMEPVILTPYDSAIYLLKEKLNNTYVAYGSSGGNSFRRMQKADTMALYELSDPTKISKYIVVSAYSHLSNNGEWDLVDAKKKDSSIVDKVDMKTLADSLQTKTRKELKQFVEAKAAERELIQKKILSLNAGREVFIAAEKAKMKSADPETLETAIEKIIREQVKRFNMTIE